MSQGLVLPTSFVTGEDTSAYELSEGQDVTEALGVLKYDPPVPAQLAGVIKGPWPSAIPKTDEGRVQNLTNEWDELRQHSYEITEKLEGSLACYEVAIQGECIGEGIEGNHYGIKGQDFYVYSIYDIVAGKYLSPEKRLNICNLIGLKHVPVIAHRADLYDTLGISTIDQVLKFSDGKSQVNPAKLREGLVYKQVDGQVHWKAVSNEYLLKHGSR